MSCARLTYFSVYFSWVTLYWSGVKATLRCSLGLVSSATIMLDQYRVREPATLRPRGFGLISAGRR